MTVQMLLDSLAQSEEHEYVRFTADWIDRANNQPVPDMETVPPLSGKVVVDALVAAAVAHVAFTGGGRVPAWTTEPERRTPTLWHPGPPGMFAYSLVHTPASFITRGLIVEADSLVCV